MHNLTVALLLLSAPSAPTVPVKGLVAPSSIIQKENRFVFGDGASFYDFEKGGAFHSWPIGLSGREITGRWTRSDETYTVTGQWGWINGASALSDSRRMTLSLYAPTSYTLGWARPSDVAGVRHRRSKIYEDYFVVEELIRLSDHGRLKQGK